ncbi:MAG: DNA mismatch repair protein MutS, partial [Lachnospiraceae bacterium]|nr:DNA mismatch repair protein MutS [Lachnospiraceae bacterium]
MGGRLLKRYIIEPLRDKKEIIKRQDAIQELYDNYIDTTELSEYLYAIYDLERLITRMAMRHANARDLISFKNSLAMLPHIYNIIKNYKAELFREECTSFDMLDDLYSLIDKAISEDCPLTLHNGDIIKSGYNKTLDEYRNLKNHGKEKLLELEEKTKSETGIKNLKIKHTKMVGDVFEITNVYKGEIPTYFIRKQTVTNAERYVTEELVKLQNDIANSEEKIKDIEYDLFVDIIDMMVDNIVRIKNVAKSIATIDCINSLATVSLANHYTRPNINEEGKIYIVDGRHPVVETIIDGDEYIPNDTHLDNKNYIDIITGPNMAGKSTYMKQIALIVILSHIGCFVPAKEADICLVDRIFTRIGASDDILRGKSTFMVEMSEVANIIDNATDKSLVLLDEIGRGTSTYDGMSIAYAILEYISKKLRSKTIFSTHYHELTELEGKLSGVNNYNITCEETKTNIRFLRKIVRGGCDKSYGVQVARLSGIK